MSTTVKKHLKKDATVNFIANLIINGLLAYFINRSKNLLLLQGMDGFAVDIGLTALFLLWILGWILIASSKKQVLKGKAPRLQWDLDNMLHTILRKFPKNAFLSGLIFGICGLLIVTPVTLGALYIVGITEMTPNTYAVFKGLWAGVLATVAVYTIVPLGLATAPEK